VVTGFLSFIVVEIPEPVRSGIQSLRDSLGTRVAKLPVEITLAGSSGVGPIPRNADGSLVKTNLARVLSQVRAFTTGFSAIRCFPNTSTYYLEPVDRWPFDQLHQAVRDSGIPFSKIPWPFNPHCTLRSGEPFSAEAAADLLARPISREEFRIDTVSIYGVDQSFAECKLLFQQSLQA
jgi:2'-5' RNA ligase